MPSLLRRFFVAGAFVSSAVVSSLFVHNLVQGHDPQSAAIKADPISFRDVVKASLPAVVSVEARTDLSKANSRNRPKGSDYQKEFEELQKRYADPQPQPRSGEQRIGAGSGVIVDSKGIVLTNYHVVANADVVELTLADGRKFTASDVKGDQRTDLAIVRFDPKSAKLPTLELGDSSQMEIGDRVLAIGAPFGLAGTVTHGIVSAKGRDIGLNRYDDFIQTDAAINPGNSGGPLINLEGKVVGINSAIQTKTGVFNGVSLAISSNMAKNVMKQLIRDGSVKRGYLGIELLGDVDSDVLKKYGVTEGGIVVNKVGEKGPADKAGLKSDDVIVALDGKAVRDLRELQKTLASLELGKPFDLAIVRKGNPQTLKITLEEEPANYGANTRRRFPRGETPSTEDSIPVDKAGMTLSDITPDMAKTLGLTRVGGALITSVERGSIAHAARLLPNMIVQKVEMKQVDSAADARDAIEAGLANGAVLLHVQSGDGMNSVILKAK